MKDNDLVNKGLYIESKFLNLKWTDSQLGKQTLHLKCIRVK